MRRDSETAWATFQERMAGLGARLVETQYLGTKVPHRAICSAGHEVAPRPGDVNRGVGICKICAGKDQGAAWRAFHDLIQSDGGVVQEPAPLGVNVPHRVQCPNGHETTATPSSVRVGLGYCHLCRRTSTARAELRFRDLVATLGGSIVEPAWLGNSKPHRVICREGHETTPRPNDVKTTGSLCRVCAGHDSVTSWLEFQRLVANQGGAVGETAWLGNKEPHRVVCARGHLCRVRPNNVQQGGSICRRCAYKVWDVFYVVVNDATQTVKFGVTSHDPRARLRFHQADGFRRVIATLVGVPDAFGLERTVLVSLRERSISPVRGREYYPLSMLPHILRIMEEWLDQHVTDPPS